MIISRLTSKAQTTIPRPVRVALGLQPGDEIRFDIVDGRVLLSRVGRESHGDDPFHSFSEWSSEADTKAYAGL